MPGRLTPESAAAALLAWLREQGDFEDTPTPLEALAAQLGLAIATFDPALYPGALGFLEPEEDLIFLRIGLSEPVRRFTLAHELGHAALHRRAGLAAEIIHRNAAGWADDALDVAADLSCDDSDLAAPAADSDEILRPGQAYSARAQREGEANAFAAALLLPAASAHAAYVELCAQDVARPALALAQRFAVSEEVALRRLAALLRQPSGEDQSATLEREAPAPAAAPLDADQRRAARAETPALIVAGPGSGKTSALLARIAYLTDERGVAPERVLALTFSRKAADDLGARLAQVMGDRAIMPRVSTIHAFCGDTLRRYGPLVGLRPDFRLITNVEGYFVLRRIVNRAPLTHYTPLSGPKMYFKDLLDAISRAKDDLITPDEYRASAEALASAAQAPDEVVAAERALEVATVYAAYQATLDERGDADYADLVARMWRLLRDEPGCADDLRARYEHILVDEFQDINYAMGALLRELAGRRGALWAVGDVDQAIYRFRGASPATLRRFTRDFEGAQVIPLGRNYRSRPQILQAASAFASAYLPGEQRITLEATRPAADAGAPAVELAVAPDSEAELDGLAQMMCARAAAGIPLRAQAVLLRTRGYVRQVCEGLRARGVPAQLAAPLLDQPLVKTLLATVSLAVDPLAMGLLRAGASLDHPFSDDDARAALQLARERHIPPLEAGRAAETPTTATQPAATQPALTTSGAAGLRRLERIIAELRSAPSVTVGMGRYIFSLTMLGRRLMDADARAQAAQVARLLEICGAFDAQRVADAPPSAAAEAPLMADWAGLLDYISAMRELGQQAGVVEEIGEGEDAALVLTAHGGKGLEFPVVYLPQLAKGRFPGNHRQQAVPAPPGLLRDQDSPDADTLIEEASAFYVALTRARDTLTLSYAQRYGKQSVASSPFLAPIEQALGDNLPHLRWDGDEAPTVSASAEESQEVAAPTTPAEPAEPAEPMVISLSEVEAYQRCPQQYAYQYVYGLWPALSPSVSLRGALREASAALRDRFNSDSEAPTLDEALALFRAHWSASRAAALHAAGIPDVAVGADGAAERDETMAAVYRLHGERVIERRWRELRAGGPTPDAARPTASPHSGPTATPISVTLAGATITGALDQVEHVASEDADASPIIRVTRLQAGALDASPSLRDLFYAQATDEMRAQGQAAEVTRVSLASGEVKPLRVLAKRRQTLENAVSAALDGLAHADYTPRPTPHTCAECPFALICPA